MLTHNILLDLRNSLGLIKSLSLLKTSLQEELPAEESENIGLFFTNMILSQLKSFEPMLLFKMLNSE